ncbi:MAG: FHIPEP family type III secretion protein [Solirubrobacterales bacterium]|nr:FHIPEP family type III secretion protein [Solirubrobacterales bacterium]
MTRDASLLAEYARQALGRAIVAPHLDDEARLRAIALDPTIEQEVSEAIAHTPDGEYLAMDPARAGTRACAAGRSARARARRDRREQARPRRRRTPAGHRCRSRAVVLPPGTNR